jgi:hypothetical protein
MPEQLFTFELEKLSQGRQGAILDNCYLAPAEDGNAVAQACTFPKLSKMQEWDSLLAGCKVKSVAKCYHWQVIYGEKENGGEEKNNFFVKVYDTDTGAIADKTHLFERPGKMEYDSEKYFCAKPFWTLRPVPGSMDSRCIAVLINENMWLADIDFRWTEPATIKGELHYISQGLRKIVDMNLQTSYRDAYKDNVSKWSANTKEWADNMLESWNQLSNYAGEIQIPMTVDLKNRLKQLIDNPRKIASASWISEEARDYAISLYPNADFSQGAYYGKWALDTTSGHINCIWTDYFSTNPSHNANSGKIRDYFNNEIKPSLNAILAVNPGVVIPKELLDAAVQKIEYFIKPDGDKPYSMSAYKYASEFMFILFSKQSGNSPFYMPHDIFSDKDYFTSGVIAWMAMIRWTLASDIGGESQIDSAGLDMLRSVADATRGNAGAVMSQIKEFRQDKAAVIAAAGKKMTAEEMSELKREFGRLDEHLNLLERALKSLDENAGKAKAMAQPILETALRKDIAHWNDRIHGDIVRVLAEMEPVIAKIVNLLLQHNVDYLPTFFDVLSSMLIVIATDNRFYYSDAGTCNIESDNFFAAQSGGGQSIPKECYRLGNRLCLLTEDTVEFWDSTTDYKQPLSPQYGHNVYSYNVMKDTAVVYDDTIYCLAQSNLLPYCSVYSISKSGAMEKISYPELDAYINARLPGSAKASLIELSKKPFVSFWLGGKAVNYDIAGNMFCLSDEILMYMCMPGGAGFYLRWDAAEAGRLTDRAGTVAKLSTPPMAMGRSSKNLKLIQVEVDNNDVEKLACEVDRQGDHAFSTTRTVAFRPGNHRNMLAKYENWGMINNNRMTLTWKGDLKINRAQWVIE